MDARQEKELTIRDMASERRYQFLIETHQGIGEIVEELELNGSQSLENALKDLFDAGASKAEDADVLLLAAARRCFYLLDSTADELAQRFAAEVSLQESAEDD